MKSRSPRDRIGEDEAIAILDKSPHAVEEPAELRSRLLLGQQRRKEARAIELSRRERREAHLVRCDLPLQRERKLSFATRMSTWRLEYIASTSLSSRRHHGLLEQSPALWLPCLKQASLQLTITPSRSSFSSRAWASSASPRALLIFAM